MATQSTNSLYPRSVEYETLQHYEKMSTDLPWNYGNKTQVSNTFSETTERNLSERMSQLSTGEVHRDIIRTIMKYMHDTIEKVPNYLAKQNKAFEAMAHQVLSSTKEATLVKSFDNKNSIEPLRKLALVLNQIITTQTYRHLWITYRKSGTGELISASQTKQSQYYAINLPIWPKEITAITLSMNIDSTKENEICLAFVDNILYHLERQLEQYQNEFHVQVKSFTYYSSSLQKMIESYIEKNLQSSLRREIQHKVQLIEYDYHIRALKLEYLRHKPNEYQKQLMFQTCQSKFEQETSKHEYILLQQQIAYYNLPNQSFASSSISQHSVIDSIQDISVRKKLFERYREAAEQSRTMLFNVYLQSAKEQCAEYHDKHESNIMKMKASQCASNHNEKSSPTLTHLIIERCNKIGERIKCKYEFKSESLLSKS